jgi:hypothetical protein
MKKTLLILFFAFTIQGFSQFSQDFEGATLPADWTVLNGGDSFTWGLINMAVSTVTPGVSHSGTKAVAIQTVQGTSVAHDDILVTPAITVTAGISDNISFWCRSINPSLPENISLVVSTTTPTAEAFTTVIDPNVAPLSGKGFNNFSYPLTAFIGQTIYVGFKSTTINKRRFDLDDVVVGAIPSCNIPTNGLFTLNSLTQATLSWTSSNTNFEILVQPASAAAPLDDAPDGTGINVVGTTYVATLPIANIGYSFYVRSECAAGIEYSTWNGPFNFDNVTMPDCAVLTSPIDGAVNVPLGFFNTGSTRRTSVRLAWNEPTTPVVRYSVFFGQDPLRLTSFFVYGQVINYGNTSYNTTYYWKVVPETINGALAENCPIYSFTTGPSPGFCMNGVLSPTITYTPQTCDGVTINTITPAPVTSGSYSNVNVVSGQTYKFESSVATDFFSLSSDNGLTAVGFGSSPFTWTSNFTGTIRVYVHLSNQCEERTTSSTRTTSVICSGTLATDNFDIANFKSYPSPVVDILNLSYNKNISTVAIYNLIGQEVISKKINDTESQIDMSKLESGTYIVKVTSEKEVKTIKVIKE